MDQVGNFPLPEKKEAGTTRWVAPASKFNAFSAS